MPREIQEPTLDERGDEVHPAYGVVHVTRPSASPGAVLFDSSIRHQHYISLTVEQAYRSRANGHDYIHGNKRLIEINLTEAQWAQMVSSVGSLGTPCTISWISQRGLEAGPQPGLPFESRLSLSAAETRKAADKALERIREAFALVEEKPTKANIKSLRFAIENAPANVEYAAKTLTEHTENVITKAKADIEAMIDARARQVGIDPLLAAQSMPMLEAGDE